MSNGLIGPQVGANVNDFSNDIAWSDHSINFFVNFARGRDVLDIGCVMHNPENYKSKYWVHKALKAVSDSLIGIDLYDDGVKYLQKLGYSIETADAQNFDLGKQFDVIVAGDIMEHLANLSGFLESCKKHLRPNGVILVSTPNPWYWRYFIKAGLLKEFHFNPEHTLWLCPRTLRQLVNRHGLDVELVSYGSRYLRDRIMPLPSGWKHTTFHAVLR